MLENVEVLLYRNTLSDENFYGIIDKIIIWSTGEWGFEEKDESYFVKNGKFLYEMPEKND